MMYITAAAIEIGLRLHNLIQRKTCSYFIVFMKSIYEKKKKKKELYPNEGTICLITSQQVVCIGKSISLRTKIAFSATKPD